MLIPYRTDAPIYHLPYATVGLILVNTAVYILCPPDWSDEFAWPLSSYMLHYGEGLHPVQWLTSTFLHGSFLHLLGNMLVLWGFGLVIEGKVGWWRFLLVYLFIGVAESALEQTLALNMVGASLGASTAIYGLIAMAMVWAPRNEMDCVFFLFFRPFTFEAPILWIAVVSIGLQLAVQLLVGFSMTSQMLHLLGAGVGLAVGVAMLKLDWVDCENWDIFALWEDRLGKPSRVEKQREAETIEQERRADQEQALAALREMLAAEQPLAAVAFHDKIRSQHPGWRLPESELLKLIALMHRQKQWAASIPLMREYLQHHSRRAADVRLKLAQILIQSEQRPAQALKVLARLDSAELSEKQRSLLRQLRRRAKELQREDPYEVAEEW